MSFTVEDFHDLVRLLEERPQWRSEMRRLVLSDEYLAVPEQIAALQREVAELRQEVAELRQEVAELRQEVAELRRDTENRLREVNEQIAELRRDTEQHFHRVNLQIGQLQTDMKAVKDDLGQLKGENLERRYRERAHAYFGRLIRKLQVLTGEEIYALLEDAVAQGTLSESDRDEVGWADLVMRGRWRADDREVMVLTEISWVADRHDVLRAIDRSTLLARLGTPVVPVIAGSSVTEPAANMARSRNVWQMLDGKVIEPAGDDAVDPNAAPRSG